jgi:hypothetical protein
MFGGYIFRENRDSAVGIATGYRLECQGVGVRVPIWSRIFSSSRPALGPTHTPCDGLQGAMSPEVKRPEHEANLSPPVSSDFKKTWIYTSSPPIRLYGIGAMLSFIFLQCYDQFNFLLLLMPQNQTLQSDVCRSNRLLLHHRTSFIC